MATSKFVIVSSNLTESSNSEFIVSKSFSEFAKSNNYIASFNEFLAF